MEDELNDDILSLIYSYLDKKSLKRYDIALTSKKLRKIFKNILPKVRYTSINVCEWTYKRGIRNMYEYSLFYNLKYVTDLCKTLVISGSINEKYSSNI